MALWIARIDHSPSSGAKLSPATSHKPARLGDCQIIALRRRGALWELLVECGEGRARNLWKLPGVVAVDRAEEGHFSDKSFGSVIITHDGNEYHFEQHQEWERGFASEGMVQNIADKPRWRQRNERMKRKQDDG